MSTLVTLIAAASLVPALFAAYGEVRDRFQHDRLHRELARAFRPGTSR